MYGQCTVEWVNECGVTCTFHSPFFGMFIVYDSGTELAIDVVGAQTSTLLVLVSIRPSCQLRVAHEHCLAIFCVVLLLKPSHFSPLVVLVFDMRACNIYSSIAQYLYSSVTIQAVTIFGRNYLGYLGCNCIGRTYTARNYAGHEYTGHNYMHARVRAYECARACARTECIGRNYIWP